MTMNTTALENETAELTLDDLEAVSGGTISNRGEHHGTSNTSVSNSGNGVGNS
jgi:hypothetical protein